MWLFQRGKNFILLRFGNQKINHTVHNEYYYFWKRRCPFAPFFLIPSPGTNIVSLLKMNFLTEDTAVHLKNNDKAGIDRALLNSSSITQRRRKSMEDRINKKIKSWQLRQVLKNGQDI